MRKILFLFAALIMSVCSAMADNITSLEQVQEDALYTLSCGRGYITVKNDYTKLYGSNQNPKTDAAANTFDAENEAFQFKFVKEGDNYYLYNVLANKYSKNDGTLVDDIADAAAISFRAWSNNTVQPYWDDTHNLNLGGSNEIAITSWKTQDPGDSFTITKLEILDYTVTVVGLTGQGGVSYKGTEYAGGATFKAAVANVALFAPVAVGGYDATISVVDNTVTVTYTRTAVSPGNYVSFLNKGHNLYLGVNANGTQLSSTATYTKANAWQLVADGTNYKLYNPESDVYAGKIASRNGAIATVSEENAGVYTIASNGNYYTLKCTNGANTGFDYFHQVNWSENAVVDWNASADASQWTIALVEYTPSVKYEVTYNYLFEGDNVGSETIRVDAGAEYPDPILAFYGYTMSAKPEGTVTENCSADITLTWSDLFKVATITDGQFAPGTKWYFLENGKNKVNGYAVYDNNEAAKSTFTTTAGSSDSYKWCFVRKPGTVFFYLYNKQAGAATPLREQLSSNSGYAANHNQGYCVIKEEGTNEMALKLEANGAGFALRLADVAGTCLLGKHVGTNLSIWGNGASLGDDGSRFVISEVPDVFHYSVAFVGAPAGETPQITVGEDTFEDGDEFDSEVAVAQTDIHATEYAGYSSVITVENYVITVTYNVKAISELSELVQGQVYTITAGGTRGAFVYTENGLNSTTKLSIDADETSENQQFLFVQKDGAYYLYSVGAHAFINVTGQNANNNRAVACGAKPVNTTLEFLASQHASKATHPVVLNIDGHHVGVSNGFQPAVITHYNSLNDEGNSLRILPVAGTTVDVTDILAAMDALDWDAYMALYNTLDAYPIGEGFGKYADIATEDGEYTLEYQKFMYYVDYNMKEESRYESNMEEMQWFLDHMQINLPKAGDLLVIKGAKTGMYVYADADAEADNGASTQLAQGELGAPNAPEDYDKWASAIFYFDGEHLISYNSPSGSGFYVFRSGLSNNPAADKDEISFHEGTKVGCYRIHTKNANSNWYDYHETTGRINRWSANDAELTNFVLEQPSYDYIHVGSTGYATVCLPVDVAWEYGESGAFTVNEVDGELKATPIRGCIPAGVPAIITGEPNQSYILKPAGRWASAEDEQFTTNVLKGTYGAIAKPENALVFNFVDDVAGFYGYNGSFLNGFKAYYENGEAASALRINFENTLTAIESAVEAAQGNEIFDLQGRRVNNAAHGLFIQNGKKVIK